MCLLKLVSTILCLIVAGSNTVSVQVNYSKFLLNKKNFITFHPVLFFRFCGYRSPPSVLVRSYILNSGFQPQPLTPTFRAYFKRNHLPSKKTFHNQVIRCDILVNTFLSNILSRFKIILTIFYHEVVAWDGKVYEWV